MADPAGGAVATRLPRAVVAWHVGRTVGRSAVVWGLAFGVVVVASVSGYISAYPDRPARLRVAASLTSNSGLTAVFGQARGLDTPGGFAAWRALGLLTLVGAAWALLTTTRVLRGEEDNGRWELLLVGQTSRVRATASALVGIAVGLSVLWVCAAAGCVAGSQVSGSGYDVRAALFLAVALVLPATVASAIAALTSQLAATRRQAAGLAATVYGICYLLRVVSDSSASLRWMDWTTPLGWVERLHPVTATRLLPLAPLAGLVVLLAAATVVAAAHRDLGASVLPDRSSRPPRLAMLRSPWRLSVRLVRGSVLGWAVGLGLLSFVFGMIAKSAANLTEGSAALRQALERIGGRPGAGAETYLGFVFLVLAAVVAVAAASLASAAREEEAQGYLDNLLVRPVARWRWLGGRVAITLGSCLLLGVVCAAGAWTGAALMHADVGLSTLLAAGLNVVPVAALVGGLGTLVHGLVPRWTAAAAYGVVAWSFLVELVGSVINASPLLLDTSVFHHVALAPAVDVRWGSNGVLLALGVAAAAVGVAAFTRRDLATA